MSARSRSLVLVAVSLLVPVLASAQGRRREGRGSEAPADRGIVLSGRVGYGFPGGDVVGPMSPDPPSMPLDALVDSKIPIWLEIGYRFNGRIWANLFLELAPVDTRASACQRTDCSASDVRFGIDVQLHLLPHQLVDPWLGVGVGAEFLTLEERPDRDERYSGWELPLVEGGLDVAVTPRFGIGPYAAFSLARFKNYRVSDGGSSATSDVSDEATHTWLQVGLKATVKL